MDLHIDLAAADGRSLRARLEHALRDALQEGRLPVGTRLPATRTLCRQLGVSRGVVQEAYTQLVAEGYLSARSGAGTIVAAGASGRLAVPSAADAGAPLRYDLGPFRPALAGFPRAAWTRAHGRVLRTLPDERLGYGDPAGTIELRGALAAYLGRVRGVRAEPEQILITAGLRHGLTLAFSALAAQGARRVAVESPGWWGMRETAVAAGLHAVGLPVDEHGLITGGLGRLDLDAVALAPAHQYPTGAVMAPGRRAALIEWAREGERVLIEDDYDAEYRYDRHPVGSLQGLAPDWVIYGGSASKTLAPAIRIGWLAVPPQLLEAVRTRLRTAGAGPPPLDQLALADLIERGELDRHLRRQRTRYRRRRDALLSALSERLPELTVTGAAAGLFLLLHLPGQLDEQAVLTAARAQGIALEGAGAEHPALVLGYANLDDSAAAGAAAALAQGIEAAHP